MSDKKKRRGKGGARKMKPPEITGHGPSFPEATELRRTHDSRPSWPHDEPTKATNVTCSGPIPVNLIPDPVPPVVLEYQCHQHPVEKRFVTEEKLREWSGAPFCKLCGYRMIKVG